MTEVVANVAGKGAGDADADTSASEHDPHFEPIVHLPEVVVCTNEEEEEEMIKLRAKLYRFDATETPSEWKERGTGEVKLLRHTVKNTVRVVMRRDKTLKICANHFVRPWMELSPNAGSDRSWVWYVNADFANESPTSEMLAIRFANAEIAQRWKEKFEEAKDIVAQNDQRKADDSDANDSSTLGEEDFGSSDEEKSEKKAVNEKDDKAAIEVAEQLEKLDVAEKDKSE